MKWLIFGGKGWIGQQLVSFLESNCKDTTAIWLAKSRADDAASVTTELQHIKPDVVFSCIGRTHGEGVETIDYLEQKGKILDNVRDNLFAPIVLADACHKAHVYFAYLGTGCIFERDGGGRAFTEADEPNFFGSGYSVVKGFTDRLMHTLECGRENTLNIRIRMPITHEPNPRNFITKITGYDKVVNVQNSMSVLPSLFGPLLTLIKGKYVGTINLTNPGTISHNEILDMYTEIVDPAFTYKNFTVAEQDAILASRRSNNELCTKVLQGVCPHVPDIKTAVRDCLRQYAALATPTYTDRKSVV